LVVAMPRKKRRLLAVTFALFALAAIVGLSINERGRFIAGGAMINAGYELQDGLHEYDLRAHGDPRPEDVWAEFLAQNHLASSVRRQLPRSAPHPLVAMVVCMDARVDTVELAGDTRKYYYVLRTAGSILGNEEEEMLELAVANGVKVIVLTTHSDCAAERIAKDPEKRRLYPNLAAAVDEREQRVRELLARPAIAAKIASGELLVRRMHIDTATEELLVSQVH
jgi:hypothetical protein